MTEERVPADYTEMDLVVAKRFDEQVRENFMPAIISTVKHLKKGGIGFVGGGFGRYVTEEELNRMKALRDHSLKEDAKAYSSPDKLSEVINKAGISNFRVSYDRAGLWAEIRK